VLADYKYFSLARREFPDFYLSHLQPVTWQSQTNWLALSSEATGKSSNNCQILREISKKGQRELVFGERVTHVCGSYLALIEM